MATVITLKKLASLIEEAKSADPTPDIAFLLVNDYILLGSGRNEITHVIDFGREELRKLPTATRIQESLEKEQSNPSPSKGAESK